MDRRVERVGSGMREGRFIDSRVCVSDVDTILRVCYGFVVYDRNFVTYHCTIYALETESFPFEL